MEFRGPGRLENIVFWIGSSTKQVNTTVKPESPESFRGSNPKPYKP